MAAFRFPIPGSFSGRPVLRENKASPPLTSARQSSIVSEALPERRVKSLNEVTQGLDKHI